MRGDRGIDPELSKACFTNGVERRRIADVDKAGPDTVAVNGKTSRRSHA